MEHTDSTDSLLPKKINDMDMDEGSSSSCCKRIFPGGYCAEFKRTMKIGVGLMLALFSQIMLGPITTIFGGHLGKLELDAIALSNSIVNVFGYSLAVGMTSACDTYFSQAYGNKQYKLVGVILQKSLYILLLLLIFCYAFLTNMEVVLVKSGQNPQVASMVQEYMFYFFPGLLFAFLYTVLRKWMACQNIVNPFVYIGFMGLGVNALLQYLLLYVVPMGIRGSALGQSLANLAMLLGGCVYIVIAKAYQLTWEGWSWSSFYDWGSFTKLGIFGILMMCLEWWAYEISIVLSGLLGTTPLGAQAVLFNIQAIFLSIGVGLTDASCIRVGQALGAGDHMQAITATRVGFTIIAVQGAVTFTVYSGLRWYLPLMFTSDADVISLAAATLPVMAIYSLFDAISVIGRGIFRGAGKQAMATLFVILAYYVIAMPIGISLMFKTSLGIIGMWIGFTIALFIMSIFYIVYLFCIMDYPKAAQEALERVGDESKGLTPDERTELIGSGRYSRFNSQEGVPLIDEKVLLLGVPPTNILLRRFFTFLLAILILAASVLIHLLSTSSASNSNDSNFTMTTEGYDIVT